MLVKVHVHGDLLMVLMDHPPVNCLSLPLRRELFEVFSVRAKAAQVSAVILIGNGTVFSAGGDLRELGTPAADTAPRISAHLFPAIERCPKPVIAALHGAAIGGGFELALACHHRIAAADTRFALPELKHGIIPLSGSQRLPRLWGIRPALHMMLDSTVVTATELAGSAVLDQVVEPRDLLPAAQAFARQLDRSTDASKTLVRNRPRRDMHPAEALDAAIESYGAERLTPVQQALVAAVRAGTDTADFDAAMQVAQRVYDELARNRGHPPVATR
jgi:enoyl-CoA hydratase